MAAGLDPAAATAAYLAKIPPALSLAADQHGQAAVIAWVLGWTGPLILAALLLRTGLVARLWRRGPLRGVFAVILFLSMASCAWELMTRAVAAGGSREGAFGGFCVDVVVRMAGLGVVLGLLKVVGQRPRLGLGVAAVTASFVLVFGPIIATELSGAAGPEATGPAAEAALELARASGVQAEGVDVSPAAPGEGDVTGLLKPVRLVLTPDAATEASVEEVKAGVGHVLGHYHARDGLGWALVLSTLGVLGAVFVVGLYQPMRRLMAPKSSGPRFHGDEHTKRFALADARGLPVLWALAAVWLAIAQPLAFAWDRAVNMRADRFSLEHAHEPDGLVQALVRQNGLEPVDPPLVERWLVMSHPPLKARIEQAMQWKAAQAGAQVADQAR